MSNRIGTLLRSLRQARQMSLERVAALAGVVASTLSRWETGAFRPRLPELDAVLRVLDASPAQRREILSLLDAPRSLRLLRAEADESTGQKLLFSPPCSGDLLRALRHRRGISLEKVAIQLGVRPNTVSRWEQSKTILPVSHRDPLCHLLHASPEECAALTEGRLLLAPLSEAESETLEGLEHQLHTLCSQAERGENVLMDLRFLTLEARLWRMLSHSDSALCLLTKTYAWHAQWLSWWDRYSEVGWYAHRVLEHARQEPKLSNYATRAVHCAGVHAVCRARSEHPERGVETLQSWISAAANYDQETWLYRDMADYASRAGQTEAALRLIACAHEAAERGADEGALRSSRYVHADILVRAGQPTAALALLSQSPAVIPFQQVLEALKWAEALLALGDRSAAHDWLLRAYATIESHEITHYRDGADRLARLC